MVLLFILFENRNSIAIYLCNENRFVAECILIVEWNDGIRCFSLLWLIHLVFLWLLQQAWKDSVWDRDVTTLNFKWVNGWVS